MHLHLEMPMSHTIQTYTNHSITVHGQEYCASVILSRREIITDVKIKSLQEIDEIFMNQMLDFKPELILLGYGESTSIPPGIVYQTLGKKGIGVECMSIGAACRTWNILLGEDRAVVAGFIFNAENV